jgi:hypothetical protein
MGKTVSGQDREVRSALLSAARGLPFYGVRILLCDCAVLEWTREDQCAAFQGPPVELLCLHTESPLTRQQFHVMKLLIETALIRMDCTWKISHDDVIQAAFHAPKTAHDRVRHHLCRKTNPHSCRKTNQLEPRLKLVRKDLLAEVSAVDAWLISAPPMKASKKPMMNLHMRHAMKVLLQNLYFTPKISARMLFFEEAETPRQTIFDELAGSRLEQNAT